MPSDDYNLLICVKACKYTIPLFEAKGTIENQYDTNTIAEPITAPF